MNDPEILVIGVGGIGGITAAHMHNAGYFVEVVDNMPGLARQIENDGLRVFGKTKTLIEKIPAYQSIHDVKGKKDIILIATKATSLCDVVNEIIALMKEDSVVVSLQNGICEEYLAEKIGKERIIGCVVGWGATVHYQGVLEKTSGGEFIIGTLDGVKVNHFDTVVRLLETTAPVVTTNNILGCLYAKLIVNSGITTLGAICGMRLGEMLSIRRVRNIIIAIIQEAVAVANASGIKIEKVNKRLDFYSFTEKPTRMSNFMRHLKLRAVGLKFRRLKSSSLQSLETGRKTEIDYLNGYITRKGRENHVDTPLNDVLVKMVKEIEERKRKISYDNFELNLFSQYN